MPRSRRIPTRFAVGCMIAAALPLPATLFIPDSRADAFIGAAPVYVIVLAAAAVLFGLLARRPIRTAAPAPTPAPAVSPVDGKAAVAGRMLAALPAGATVVVLEDEMTKLAADHNLTEAVAELLHAARRP